MVFHCYSINTLEYHLAAVWKSTCHVCWLVFTFWSTIIYRPSPEAWQDLPHLFIWFLPSLCILQLDFVFLVSIHLLNQSKAKTKQWQRGKELAPGLPLNRGLNGLKCTQLVKPISGERLWKVKNISRLRTSFSISIAVTKAE